jgi:hypothetical protein
VCVFRRGKETPTLSGPLERCAVIEVALKHRLNFIGLHGVISQEMELFITAVLRTSNSTLGTNTHFLLQLSQFWLLSTRPFFSLKHNISETWFCLRLHVEPTQLSSIDKARLYLRTQSYDSYLRSSFIAWNLQNSAHCERKKKQCIKGRLAKILHNRKYIYCWTIRQITHISHYYICSIFRFLARDYKVVSNLLTKYTLHIQ